VTYFDRYISHVEFSKDDKNLAFILRNGFQEYNVAVFDFLEKKPRKICQEKFNFEISSIAFMPRDSSKLLISGENLFQLYQCGRIGLAEQPEFDDIPKKQAQLVSGTKMSQLFTASCYTENTDQLIGCSNMGDIFVIEVMGVVQVIKQSQLISPSSEPGTRLNLKFCVSCRFGFLAASKDVIYFFKLNAKRSGKPTYQCILRWRAPEFEESHITSLSIQEGGDKSPEIECNLAIATKNNQIMYLNLYK